MAVCYKVRVPAQAYRKGLYTRLKIRVQGLAISDVTPISENQNKENDNEMEVYVVRCCITCPRLAGNEGMAKHMEITILGGFCGDSYKDPFLHSALTRVKCTAAQLIPCPKSA